MPVFRFRLSAIHRLREVVRDERRASLAQAYQADGVLEERLRSLERQAVDLRNTYRATAKPGTLDVDRLMDVQRHGIVLHLDSQHCRRQRELLAAEIERRRDALAAAEREVRVLENLREKHRQRFLENEARREQKLLDEFATIAAARKEAPWAE
ncbi:MAG: flagellar export protein FliJ [Pirellulales bacterium]